MNLNVILISLFCLIILQSCDQDENICPSGFTGNNCDEELIPKSISINSLTLNYIPRLNEYNEPWDQDGHPDLKFYFSFDNQIIELADRPDFNASAITVLRELDSLPTLTDYRFLLIDQDEQYNELMGTWNVELYHPGQFFPPRIKFISLNGMELSILLTYNF